MGQFRDNAYKDLLVRYKKDKIRNYFYKKEKNLTVEKKRELEKKVDDLFKEGIVIHTMPDS